MGRVVFHSVVVVSLHEWLRAELPGLAPVLYLFRVCTLLYGFVAAVGIVCLNVHVYVYLYVYVPLML